MRQKNPGLLLPWLTLSLYLIHPGERPLLPGFGCRIHGMQSLRTEAERHLGAALIEEAIERWVPWLRVDRVEILEARSGIVRLAVERRSERGELEIRLRGKVGLDVSAPTVNVT